MLQTPKAGRSSPHRSRSRSALRRAIPSWAAVMGMLLLDRAGRWRSVRLSPHAVAAGPDQEVEVGARVGLLHMVDVQPLPPAGGRGEGSDGRGRGLAGGELVGRDVDLEQPALDV